MLNTKAQEPFHIIHLIEGLGPGGAERLLYTNLKHLDRRRFRSTVVTVFPQEKHWEEPIRQLGIEVIGLNCRNYRSLPAATIRLHTQIRRSGANLVHTHLWSANIIGRLAGWIGGTPVISSVHSPDYEPAALQSGTTLNPLKWKMALTLDKWTARLGCNRMIAVSEYVRQCTASQLRFPLPKIDLLYNPVDIAEIGNGPNRSRNELLAEIGLPPDAVVLLNVGRLAPEKGFLDAVRALPAVRRHYSAVHLVSVGSMANIAWVDRVNAEVVRLQQNQHVHLLGSRRDVVEWLHACDLFLFPSLFEGLGIALIEAMVAGCACVASRTGPMPEVIQDGQDGVLVDPNDPEGLAQAICDLLRDPARRQKLGRAARGAVDRFDPTVAAEKLAAIYEAICATSKSRAYKAGPWR